MDEAEFDAFYVSAYPRLVRQLHAVTGDREEAADCAQEAFAKAWSRRWQLAAVECPEAWVRTIAYRLAVSRWRRIVKGRRAPDRALQAEHVSAAPSEAHVAVVAALRQLPEAQRVTLALHYLGDLSVADVAAQLGVAEGTVKARLSRGRVALQAILGPQDDAGIPAQGASRV